MHVHDVNVLKLGKNLPFVDNRLDGALVDDARL